MSGTLSVRYVRLDTIREIVHTVTGNKKLRAIRMMNLKKYAACLITAAALSAMLFSGCGSERKENQLAYRTIGLNSMESGDYEGAVAAFSSALSLGTGAIGAVEIDLCYYKAAAQYASGDVDGALATYQSLLDYDSKDANTYYMRGSLLLGSGETEKALSDYDNAVKYNSDDYELYMNIYQNLAAYNMADKGEEYLNTAFEIKGDGAGQLAWRGKIYYLLGQYENAQKELSAALEKGSAEANLTMAQVYEAQGDMEKAEGCYQAYLATGTADSEAMNALAEIEMGKGNYSAALDYINQGLAMEQVSNKKALMRNKIAASEYTGDFASAWAVMQEYTALYPDDMKAQREAVFLKNRQPEGTPKDSATETEAGDTPETDQEPAASTEGA